LAEVAHINRRREIEGKVVAFSDSLSGLALERSEANPTPAVDGEKKTDSAVAQRAYSIEEQEVWTGSGEAPFGNGGGGQGL
jgi:hypothetical protein